MTLLVTRKLAPPVVIASVEPDELEADDAAAESAGEESLVGDGVEQCPAAKNSAGLTERPAGVPFGRALLVPLILAGSIAGWPWPPLENSRESARLSVCRCKFCSIILDAHNKAEMNRGHFPGPAIHANGQPPKS